MFFWLRREGFQDGTVPWAWSAEHPSRTKEKSAESDKGVGSLFRRSEHKFEGSLAWSDEYPPGQRRSLGCEAVVQPAVGLE